MKIGRIMHVHSSALLRDAKEQNRLMMMSSVTILIVGSKEGKFILLVLYIQEEKLLPSLLLFRTYNEKCNLQYLSTWVAHWWVYLLVLSVLGESFPSYSCLTPPTELAP